MEPPQADIDTEEALEEVLSEPTPEVAGDLAAVDGDLLILGVGGKMGPTLARMARRALTALGSKRRVMPVNVVYLLWEKWA